MPALGLRIKGRLRVKYADHEEVLSAGEVYYLAPGHIPVVEEPLEIVEFSPPADYEKTTAALTARVRRAAASGQKPSSAASHRRWRKRHGPGSPRPALTAVTPDGAVVGGTRPEVMYATIRGVSGLSAEER